MKKLGLDVLDRLRTDGYAIVEDFLSPEELAAGQQVFRQHFPDGSEFFATPEKFLSRVKPGIGISVKFPDFDARLQHLCTSDDILNFVEEFHGCADAALVQSFIWAKYARTRMADQPLHIDGHDITMVYPSTAPQFRLLQMTVFYSNVRDGDGALRILPDGHWKPDLWPAAKPRDSHPELYEREIAVNVGAGGLAITTDATFHRGTKFSGPTAYRWSHHFAYCARRATWFGYQCWPHGATKEQMVAFLSKASPRQREVMGFPARTSGYWTAETVAGMAERYPAMDLSDYAEYARRG